MKKLTPAQKVEIVESYASGVSSPVLAARYKVSPPCIRLVLHKNGVTIRPLTKSELPTEIVEREVLRLWDEGVRLSRVVQCVHTDHSKVVSILEKHGLYKRRTPKEDSISRRKIRPEHEQAVTQAYLSGVPLAQLALAYKCTPVPVKRALLRAGVEIRKRGGAAKALAKDPTFYPRVKELWDSGRTQTAIAADIGCGQPAVSMALRKMGINCRVGGDRHGMWKGGRRVTDDGYIMVLLTPEHPMWVMAGANGYALEHRLHMAEYLGRPLLKHETVHHKDGITDHNDLENLQLRIGRHGRGACFRCGDCGSRNIRSEPL